MFNKSFDCFNEKSCDLKVNDSSKPAAEMLDAASKQGKYSLQRGFTSSMTIIEPMA